MKKLFLLPISLICFLLCFNISSSASYCEKSDISVNESTYERVLNEVKTGDITNDEDVIKVALMQQKEKYSLAPFDSNDNTLSITQVIDTYTNEDGEVLENILATGLFVVDKNGNPLDQTTIEHNGAQISEFSIYYTMDVSVTVNKHDMTVRFNYFDTILRYGTAMNAASLKQESTYNLEPYFEIHDKVKKVYDFPEPGTYRYEPENKDMITYSSMGRGRCCFTTVVAGGKSYYLSFTVINGDPDGYWDSGLRGF